MVSLRVWGRTAEPSGQGFSKKPTQIRKNTFPLPRLVRTRGLLILTQDSRYAFNAIVILLRPPCPIVACGSCSNPLLRILGSVLAVAGVIFAHDASIEKPGAFSGVITLSLAWYNPVSRGRDAWLRSLRNGGPYINEQLM